MAAELMHAAQQVREGRSLAGAMQDSGVYPDVAIKMVEVGESTGALQEMLNSLSDFYDEEMLLQAGLFDESPRSRDIVYNMMRLRALRVEVDVKLALGQFTLDQAAEYLATTVPMDRATARGEAVMFASTPGQAISYQTGKLQIHRLVADARLRQGEKFRLRDLHDFLFGNGYVPMSLVRWEYLGLRDELDALERLK